MQCVHFTGQDKYVVVLCHWNTWDANVTGHLLWAFTHMQFHIQQLHSGVELRGVLRPRLLKGITLICRR